MGGGCEAACPGGGGSPTPVAWAPPGVRPLVTTRIEREYGYAYAAVSPHDGAVMMQVPDIPQDALVAPAVRLALADVDLLSGLIDGRDRRKRILVEQDVRTGRAVRLDQHLKFCRWRRRRAGGRQRDRDIEVDFNQHGGAADAHGRNRGCDLHVAGFGDLAGDEARRALHQRQQRMVGCAGGVVGQVVQHQP